MIVFVCRMEAHLCNSLPSLFGSIKEEISEEELNKMNLMKQGKRKEFQWKFFENHHQSLLIICNNHTTQIHIEN